MAALGYEATRWPVCSFKVCYAPLELFRLERAVEERRKSAYGYKQKSKPTPRHVCFAPNNGHSSAHVRFRADFVCLTPSFGRSEQGRWTSAFDPEPSLP